MAKLSSGVKEQILLAVRHPVRWWRGNDLPEDAIHPWEGGIQFLAESLKGFMSGYTGIKDRLYLGMGEGMIPPNWKSVHDVIKMSWDAVNDPLIGTYMDRRRLTERANRWIMRINATLSPFFILIQCFDFGLTPLQRVIMWTIMTMFGDVMSTANAVSESKIWAGITPHAQQRGIVQTCRTVGNQLSYAARGIPTGLMGLSAFTGLTDYKLMIYGALIFTPLTIFCRWLPSFAKQRVDFTVKVQGEDETKEEAERTPTLRESFAVVRHNRWWVLNTITNMVRMVIPGTDEMFFYRFLLPKYQFRGKEVSGEFLWMLQRTVFGLPCLIAQPFAVKVIGKFKNEVNFIRVHVLVNIAITAAKFLIGYNSTPRLLAMFLLNMLRDFFDKWAPVAHGQIQYEMLDYVEWKTGQRSEGVTLAVDGMLNKLIKNNVNTVLGNAVTQWTQYQSWDTPAEQQPKRFLNSIWPLMHVGTLVGETIFFIALCFFKYPHDPKAVEADLIERRANAQQAMEEEAQPPC